MAVNPVHVENSDNKNVSGGQNRNWNFSKLAFYDYNRHIFMKDSSPVKWCLVSRCHQGWVGCSSAGAEEHFDGVVVDGVGELQQVLLPCCRHHLQNLSATPKKNIISEDFVLMDENGGHLIAYCCLHNVTGLVPVLNTMPLLPFLFCWKCSLNIFGACVSVLDTTPWSIWEGAGSVNE